MLDKLLISFRDNISRNTRNPFLGTLIFIWIIRNWKIVYAIFFDNRKFEVRLQFIQDQISATIFWEILGQFGINVGLAILVVITIYSLIYLTRFITNKFENQLLPWIYDISSEGKIVLKEKFDKLQSEKAILEERLDKEREKRVKAEAEVERLEKRETERMINDLKSPSKTKEDVRFSDLEKRLIEKYGSEIIETALSNVKNQFHIFHADDEFPVTEDLFKLGFLISKDQGTSSTFYSIASEGEEFLRKLYD